MNKAKIRLRKGARMMEYPDTLGRMGLERRKYAEKGNRVGVS